MYILEFYYEKIIKPDLLNKFKYKSIEHIPSIKKVVLNFGCKNHEIKSIAAALLSLELISNKRGNVKKSRKPNVFLKIRKGAPIGCSVILKNRAMYLFLFKLIVEIFPILKDFKGIPFYLNKKKYNNFSFYIEDLVGLKELKNHFYLFNNLPSLNITIVTNTKTEYEFLYLLKSFKIPLLLK